MFKIDCERSPIFELTHYFTIPNAALQIFNKCPAILRTGTSAFLSLVSGTYHYFFVNVSCRLYMQNDVIIIEILNI